MEELLSKAKIDLPRLRRTVHKFTANELSKLTEPCYEPKTKKYYHELLKICNLTERDTREFTKRFYKGTAAAQWHLHRDEKTNFYIFLMYVFLKNRDEVAYLSMVTLHMIRVYGSLIRISFPRYCDPKVFKYTLDNLTKTHLFAREKSIPNAIYYLSKELAKNYRLGISKSDVDQVTRFIQGARTRLHQSVKSFAEAYYKASEEGLAYTSPVTHTDEEGEEQQQYEIVDRLGSTIESVVKRMTVYKEVDRAAIEEAKRITRINASLAQTLTTELSNLKYGDNIKLILELFFKQIKTKEDLCGKSFYDIVKNLMGIKRTNARIYFKQQVDVLLTKLIKNINYEETYNKLTNQTKFLINSYLAYYVTIFTKNKIC